MNSAVSRTRRVRWRLSRSELSSRVLMSGSIRSASAAANRPGRTAWPDRCQLLAVLQGRGERRHGGVFEQVDDGDVAAQLRDQPAMQPGQAQRVAAEVEEVVVRTDVLGAQHLRPHRGDAALEL